MATRSQIYRLIENAGGTRTYYHEDIWGFRCEYIFTSNAGMSYQFVISRYSPRTPFFTTIRLSGSAPDQRRMFARLAPALAYLKELIAVEDYEVCL